MNHQIDQILGCGLQVGQPRSAHRAGDIQHHGHLDVARGAQHFGGTADGQVVVHQLAVGRQDDVGDQDLHVHAGVGGDLVVVQGEAGGVLAPVLEIVRHIGLQRRQAHAVQVDVVGVFGAGGGQGGGVQRVLQVGFHLGGLMDVDGAETDHDQHRQGHAEHHGHIAAGALGEAHGEGPRRPRQPI